MVFYILTIRYFFFFSQQLGHRATDLSIPRKETIAECEHLAEMLHDISPFISSFDDIPLVPNDGLPLSSASELLPSHLSADQWERIKGHQVTWREKQRQLRSSFDK